MTENELFGFISVLATSRFDGMNNEVWIPDGQH